MPKPIVLRIDVDDKGNPKLAQLTQNIKKAEKVTIPLSEAMKAAFASTVVLRGIAMINRSIVASTKSIYEYELAMKRVSAITGTTGSDLETFSDTARQMATDTEHSATSISKAMLEMSKMGLDTTEVLQAVPHVLDMATVSGTELGGTAKDLVSILKAFNLEYSETDRVANVVATTVNKTALDWDDFREAMKFVAPIAKSTNMELEEVAALMGTIGDVGIRGSLGGTALKNMFLNILKPSEDVAKKLQKMDLNGKSFADMLSMMKDSGLDVIDFLETFNKRAVAPSLAIAELSDKTNELEEALRNGTKSIAEQASEIRDSHIIAWQRMLNIMNEIGLSIADAFGDRPQTAIEGVIDLLKGVDTWIDNNQASIKKIARILETTFNTTVGFISENMGAVLVTSKALVKVWAVLWVHKNISKVATATLDVAVNMKKAALAASTFQASLGVITAIGLGVIYVLEKLDGEVQRQNSNMKNFQSEETLSRLIAMRDKMKEIQKYENMWAGKVGKQSLEKAVPAIRVLKEELQDLQKDYKKTFGKTSIDFVDTLPEIENQIKGMTHILGLLDKVKEKEEDGKERNPLNSSTPEEEDGISSKAEGMAAFLKKLNEVSAKENTDRTTNFLKNLDKAHEADKKAAQSTNDFLNKLEDANTADRKERVAYWVNFGVDAAQQTMDIWSQVYDLQDAKEQRLFDKRMKRLEDSHDLEIARAGDSAFRRQMAEEKYISEKKKLEDDYERKRLENAKKQKALAITQSIISGTRAAIGAAADTPGLPSARMAAGFIMGAFGAAQTALIAAQPLREGGYIAGQGGGTSDSNFFRGSVGERVVSNEEIRSIGGQARLEQILDRASGSTTIQPSIIIQNVIGSNEWVRDELIPTLNEEYSRW